jgi:hypothetical protein
VTQRDVTYFDSVARAAEGWLRAPILEKDRKTGTKRKVKNRCESGRALVTPFIPLCFATLPMGKTHVPKLSQGRGQAVNCPFYNLTAHP